MRASIFAGTSAMPCVETYSWQLFIAGSVANLHIKLDIEVTEPSNCTGKVSSRQATPGIICQQHWVNKSVRTAFSSILPILHFAGVQKSRPQNLLAKLNAKMKLQNEFNFAATPDYSIV